MLLPPLTPPSVTVTPWQLPTQQLANLYERANEDHYALVAGVQSCFLGGASDAMSQSMHGLPVSFAHVAAMAAVRIALAVLSHHLSCSLMLCPFIGDSYTPLADSARPSLPQSAMVLSGMLGALWLRSLEEAIPGTSIDKVPGVTHAQVCIYAYAYARHAYIYIHTGGRQDGVRLPFLRHSLQLGLSRVMLGLA